MPVISGAGEGDGDSPGDVGEETVGEGEAVGDAEAVGEGEAVTGGEGDDDAAGGVVRKVVPGAPPPVR